MRLYPRSPTGRGRWRRMAAWRHGDGSWARTRKAASLRVWAESPSMSMNVPGGGEGDSELRGVDRRRENPTQRNGSGLRGRGG